MRRILGIYDSPRSHWVGDGFPVRSLFSHATLGDKIDPFLLLDYAGPAEFAPTQHKRGVGVHPHRGFETVTVVYQGEVAHRDSAGNGGLIGPGDVQWMTAASGIQHEEFHSEAFAQKGGMLEMVQLWVNLPKASKSAPPAYQTLLAHDIPVVALPEDAGQLRVIAGSYLGRKGPARTFTPIDLWDLRLNRGGTATLDLPSGYNAGIVVLHGTVQVNGDTVARASQFVLFGDGDGAVTIEAAGDAKLLLLAGEPIDEPVVMHGPFVMNTVAEIERAVLDFHQGRFGALPAPVEIG